MSFGTWPLTPSLSSSLAALPRGSLCFGCLAFCPSKRPDSFLPRALYLLSVLPGMLLPWISVHPTLLIYQVLAQMPPPWRRGPKQQTALSFCPATCYLLPLTAFSFSHSAHHYLKSSYSIFGFCSLPVFLQSDVSSMRPLTTVVEDIFPLPGFLGKQWKTIKGDSGHLVEVVTVVV